MKNLYVDLDSTLNDHWRRIANYSRNGIILPEAFSREIIMIDTPIEDATWAMNRFHDDGWVITVLTARDFPEAKQISWDWLNKHNFPIAEVLTVPGLPHKIQILKDAQPDLYIDDFTTGQEYQTPRFRSEVYETIRQFMTVEPFRNNWEDIVKRYLCV